MIVSGRDRVIVQGITGRQARFWTGRMAECGTRIVAGVAPGRGGQQVEGVPVYDSVAAAVEEHGAEVSVLFVPPLAATAAAVEAVEAGVGKLVLLTEHIPAHDVMELLAVARDHGAAVVGPNTAGLVVPGEAAVGIMPAFAPSIFRRGNVGVVSRSGSLGTLVCLNLVSAGYGQSAFVGIGGDPILGTTTVEAVCALRELPDTEAVVIVGEIGGTLEEDAAEYLSTLTEPLPVVGFVAGRTAPPDRRMGHAGAIVAGGRGDGRSKVEALRAAGVAVVDVPSQIGDALASLGVTPSLAELFDELKPRRG